MATRFPFATHRAWWTFSTKRSIALFVDALGRFEDFKIDADGSCEMHKGLEIFREAEAAEAQAGTKELAANAGIEPDGLRDFFNPRRFFRRGRR